MKYLIKAFPIAIMIARRVPSIVKDGKVTIREILDVAIEAAAMLGVRIDDEGIDLASLRPRGH